MKDYISTQVNVNSVNWLSYSFYISARSEGLQLVSHLCNLQVTVPKVQILSPQNALNPTCSAKSTTSWFQRPPVGLEACTHNTSFHLGLNSLLPKESRQLASLAMKVPFMSIQWILSNPTIHFWDLHVIHSSFTLLRSTTHEETEDI